LLSLVVLAWLFYADLIVVFVSSLVSYNRSNDPKNNTLGSNRLAVEHGMFTALYVARQRHSDYIVDMS